MDNNARRTCSDDARLVPSDNKKDIRGRERRWDEKKDTGKNGTETEGGGRVVKRNAGEIMDTGHEKSDMYTYN